MYAKNRWLILTMVASALFLIVIDMTVLYTALPRLTQALDASASQKLWIVNAYPLVVAGLLPGAGMLSDRIGHKRLFLAGLPVFAVASLCAAFSPTLGNGYVGGVPVPVIIFIVLFALAWLVLNKTLFGRYIYAVGGNPKSARTSGINVTRIKILVYTLCGALAGIAGLILTARTGSAQTNAGAGYELDAIAAVVIGGTSMAGGVGTLVGTFFGVLIIGVMNNGLDLLGVQSYYQQIIKGALIVLAVLLDPSRKQQRD